MPFYIRKQQSLELCASCWLECMSSGHSFSLKLELVAWYLVDIYNRRNGWRTFGHWVGTRLFWAYPNSVADIVQWFDLQCRINRFINTIINK